MKRTLSLLLALVLLLPGCGKKEDETTIQPCEVIVRVMRAWKSWWQSSRSASISVMSCA